MTIDSKMSKFSIFAFPVGFRNFHQAHYLLGFNFQLNRYYTLGWLKAETLIEVALRIEDFHSWKREMIKFAEQAEAEDRLRDACILYRAAEFYTNPTDPDKDRLYNKFTDLFYTAFRGDPIERFEIPFEDGFLSAMRLTPERATNGIIVMHGGFDSFIEELYPLATYIANKGFDIIMFEGPGQGRPLHSYGLKMTHEWENPVRTVIDYFKLIDVTLIGMSLGGFLAPRAAAFESRISRVVLWGVVYDLIGQIDLVTRSLLKLLLGLKAKSVVNGLFNRLIKRRKLNDPRRLHSEWFYSHALYNTGCETVYDYLKEANENYTTKNVSHLIKQDVLMLVGEDDIQGKARSFFTKQKNALTNANSVTGRVFTREEHASQHCQAGNIKLALDYILNWIATVKEDQ